MFFKKDIFQLKTDSNLLELKPGISYGNLIIRLSCLNNIKNVLTIDELVELHKKNDHDIIICASNITRIHGFDEEQEWIKKPYLKYNGKTTLIDIDFLNSKCVRYTYNTKYIPKNSRLKFLE